MLLLFMKKFSLVYTVDVMKEILRLQQPGRGYFVIYKNATKTNKSVFLYPV